MENNSDQTSRLGIHAVGLLFEKIGWIFREQPTSDYGIDAQAEKRGAGGSGEGKLIALQIKSGASYFRKKGKEFIYRGEQRHLEYWISHSLPVFLILHNPITGLTIWQRVAEHLATVGENGQWTLRIPENQTLDESNAHVIAAGMSTDLGSLRRARLILDMAYIRQLASEEIIFMRIDDWVNKTLNMRGAEFVFDEDPDGEVHLEIGAYMPSYTVEYYMAVAFPWLDWELHEYIDESNGAYEVAQHILKVKVNDIGRSAIILDDFYASEAPIFDRPKSMVASEVFEDRDDGFFDD